MPIEIPRGFVPTPRKTRFFWRLKDGEKGRYDASRMLVFAEEKINAEGKLEWHVFPEGGGMQRSAEPSVFIRDCLLAVSSSDFRPPLYKAWFTLGDDETRYEGYTDGTAWNGWAAPFLPQASFEQLQKVCWKDFKIDERPECECADLGEGLFVYDPVLDANRAWYFGQSVQYIPIVEKEIGGQKVRLFNCGDLGLCWTETEFKADPSRGRWTDDGKLDGFELRCPNHPDREIFIANGGKDPETPPEQYEDAETCYFQVRKDGENTNIHEDGIVGVPAWAHEFHDMGDTIDVQCPQCGESADLWDVTNNQMAEERFEGELKVARRQKE